MQPLVSVCIPSYNHAKYLVKSLESLAAQTYRPLEIVVLDDGSTDDSLTVLQQCQRRWPELIRLYTHPERANRGISATVNRLLELYRGEYWAAHSSDDFSHPTRLERQVEYLQQYSDVGMVYAFCELANEASEPIAGIVGKDITGSPCPLATLIAENRVPTPTMLVRRRAADAVGKHRDSLLYSDWDFVIRLSSHCKIGCIPEPLMSYRLHGSNTSQGVPRDLDLRRTLEVMESLQIHAAEIGGELNTPRILQLLELQQARLHFLLGDRAETARHLCRSGQLEPNSPFAPSMDWQSKLVAALPAALSRVTVMSAVKRRIRNAAMWAS